MSDSDRDSDSATDTEMEEPDEQAAAEIRAIAKIMLHGRARNDILDAGYHRFAFHDTHLPKWFAEDERRHMKCAPILIVALPICPSCHDGQHESVPQSFKIFKWYKHEHDNQSTEVTHDNTGKGE